MSALMVWRPVLSKPEPNGLDYPVHKALLRRYFPEGTAQGTAHLGRADVSYLEGLRDAVSSDNDRQDIKEILNAIGRYGSVELEIIP